MDAHKDESTPSAPRTTIGNGRYELIDIIGEGAMAVVWRAYDSRLREEVAVKILKVGVPETIRQRFALESNIMFRLGRLSRNIVTVIDFDNRDDEHYMAMEYVDGSSAKQEVADLVTQGASMPTEHVLGVTIEVLKALVVAHKAGVVHCDIKPENVLIVRDGSVLLRVFIMDFGVAHIDGLDLTQDGEYFGTLAYIGPEILEDGYTSEARRDIYAVGCLLYELATGKLPTNLFRLGAQPQRLEMVRQVLRQIVLTATHPNPDERYQTAAEMLAVLEALLMKITKAVPTSLEIVVTEQEPVHTDAPAAPVPLPPLPPSREDRARERLKVWRNETAPKRWHVSNPLEGRRVNWRAVGVLGVVVMLVVVGVMWRPSSVVALPETEDIAPVQVASREPMVATTGAVTLPAVEMEIPTVVQTTTEPPPIVAAEPPTVKAPAATKASGTKPTTPPDTTPRLVHKVVKKAAAGSTVSISAVVRNVDVKEIWLFSRTVGTTRWSSIRMQPSASKGYEASLAEAAEGTEYYISANPKTEGDPITSGDRTNPHVIIAQ